MYKNETNPELDERDMTDEEYSLLCTLDPKLKELMFRQFSEMIAYYIALWCKFKCFKLENTSYNRISETALDQPSISKSEKEDYIKKSKAILRDRYGIEVVSDDPMILSSDVPFEDIEV